MGCSKYMSKVFLPLDKWPQVPGDEPEEGGLLLDQQGAEVLRVVHLPSLPTWDWTSEWKILISVFFLKNWPSRLSFIWTNYKNITRTQCLLICLGWAGWCHGEVLGHAHVHHQCPSEDGHEGSGTSTCTGASAREGWLFFRYAKMLSKQGFM